MRTEILKEFLLFTESMNYTKAAKQLNISQSGLSKHMIDLERETGLELFTHSISDPALTEVGRVFLQGVSLIDAELEAVLRKCRELQNETMRPLLIQKAEISSAIKFIYQSVRSWQEQKKGASAVFVDIAGAAGVKQALNDKIIDVGIDIVSSLCGLDRYEKELEEDGFAFIRMTTEQLMVWFRNDNRLSQLPKITYDDIKKTPIITSTGSVFDSIQLLIRDVFAQKGDFPKFKRFYFEDANYSFTYFLLNDFENAVLFTTQQMLGDYRLASRPDITSSLVEGEEFSATTYLVAEKNNVAACEFLDFFASTFDQLLKQKEEPVNPALGAWPL